MRILTLGVYERNEAEFFDIIVESKMDLFVDVRRIRGLRGGTYKFANSNYLQTKLATLEISYWHALYLAPAVALRALQSQTDKELKILKRDRETLNPVFIKAYSNEVLRQENLESAAAEIQTLTRGKQNPAICLFCVERRHEACHRSLLAEALAVTLSASIHHL